MSLSDQFAAASARFAEIAGSSSDMQKLSMYALWNQATNGDVDPKTEPSCARETFLKRKEKR